MAELNGREVIVERYVSAPDVEKVIVYSKDNKETSSVFLKDLILTDEEHKHWLDHTHKSLELKTTSWEKRREAHKQAMLDNKAKDKVVAVKPTQPVAPWFNKSPTPHTVQEHKPLKAHNTPL